MPSEGEAKVSLDVEMAEVIFHAALLGRADIVKNALSSLKSSGDFDEENIKAIISRERETDHATPLHIAANLGHVDVVRTLVNAGANLNCRPSKGPFAGQVPFEAATGSAKQTFVVIFFEQVAIGNLAAICQLLDGGLMVDSKDGSATDDSTLHWAASFGNVEVLRLLISRGCNVNIRNSIGQLPIHLGVKNAYVEIVRQLLLEGASVWAEDCHGNRPVDLIPTNKQEVATELKELLTCPPHPTMELHGAYLNSLVEARPSLTSNKSDEQLLSEALEPSADSPQEGDINKLLVFWPAVQMQQHNPCDLPLVLRSDENLLVCISNSDVDLFPVLTWSGFLEQMDVYGFQVQVKRTAPGAKIRLCTDSNVCPRRHSYRLQCDHDQLSLIAADYTGLLYGMYTLIQLIQLHSNIGLKQGVAHIAVPAVDITDFPDISQRAVLWSFHDDSRMQQHPMKECVELMSRLRLNMLFLAVPPVCVDENGAAQEEHAGATANESTSTRVYLLDEECRRRCVELVPTVVVTSVRHRLPLDILKNFSHSMISLVLNFPEQGEGPDHAEQCKIACKTLLKDAQLAGFSTVQTTSSKWTLQHANPRELARHVGITIVEREANLFHHSSLLAKPIIATHEYIQLLEFYVDEVKSSMSTCAVLPAFAEKDFWYPIVLLKYYMFHFSGLCWNGHAFDTVMGDSQSVEHYSPLLRELLCLLVFPANRAVKKPQMDCVLRFLTTEWSSWCKAVHGADPGRQCDAATEEAADIFRSEKLLWTLVTLREEEAVCCVVPWEKMALAPCLKFYRKFLSLGEWKAHQLDRPASDSSLMQFLGVSSGVGSDDAGVTPNGRTCNLSVEVEEMFVVVNMLSVACKTLMQTHNSFKKHGKPGSDVVGLRGMVQGIPIGLKSDLANSLLEALTGFSFVWRRRFERRLLDMLRESLASAPPVEPQQCGGDVRLKDLHALGTSWKIIEHCSPKMPNVALFQCFCSGLIVQSLQRYMERIFC